jgi:hypothetical protein
MVSHGVLIALRFRKVLRLNESIVNAAALTGFERHFHGSRTSSRKGQERNGVMITFLEATQWTRALRYSYNFIASKILKVFGETPTVCAMNGSRR